MNRIDRLTAILLLLQAKPRTSEEIAQQFEVSKRTILRDVQALCEIGVPIIAREGVGGGYSLPLDYVLAPLRLNPHEAFLLLLSLDAIARLTEAPFAQERVSLMAKLRAILPRQQIDDVEQLLATVSVDVPRRSQRAPFLDQLIAAASRQQWLQITYQSAERVSMLHIMPRQISSQNGFWYCHAYAYERQEERIYRIDRIRALAPATAELPPAPPKAARPYNHESHPEVLVSLTARGVAYVESEPQLGQQIVRLPDGAGRLAFRCPPSELDWFARYFAGLGAEATVHGPPELRQSIRRLAHQLLGEYE
jgi:predicted DNA-binding transcriptional regulator YafY